MLIKHLLLLSLFVLVIMNCCNFAAAQVNTPRPPAGVGGATSSQMRSIYRSDIGTGFSANSMNSNSLNRARARIGNVGQATATSPRLDVGLGAPNLDKPFSGYTPAPTVSPYMNLFRDDFEGNDDFNYQTLVRPQLQQQQFNQQLQRQNMDISRRLQAISAQANYNPQGSQSQAPTGHQTVFGYYGHYYPAMNRRR